MTQLNAVDEIKYYCKQKYPMGALLLKGEWGSGKTYLVNEILTKDLNSSHIIVRISLFGIDSVEALNCEVKENWLKACSKLFKPIGRKKSNNGNSSAVLSGLGDLIGFAIPAVKELKKAMLSVNILDMFSITPTINNDGDEKIVVLVFDDLERSKIEVTDILGCINNYCENMGFHVIIIANEEKIIKAKEREDNNNSDGTKEREENEDNLTYLDFKEKIVCRTVKYIPEIDYTIENILSEPKWDKMCEQYGAFLKHNIDTIKSIFNFTKHDFSEDIYNSINGMKENEIIDCPPMNLRSLKCALQDFSRIYKYILLNDIKETEKFLYSFIALEMIQRKKTYNEPYGNSELGKFIRSYYPEFGWKYVFKTAFDWVCFNNWNEVQLLNEIKMKVEEQRAKEPKEILKYNRIIDVDDDILRNGFIPLLADAYAGGLNLNEYIQLLANDILANNYKINLPEHINWDKVVEGIDSRIKYEIESRANNQNEPNLNIDEKYLIKCSEKQREAYQKIKEFYENRIVFYEENKRKYLLGCDKGTIREFALSEERYLNTFDIEMAKKTISCFDASKQADKFSFITYFRGIWVASRKLIGIKNNEVAQGMGYLLNEIKKLKRKYVKNNMQLALLCLSEFEKEVKKIEAWFSDTYRDIVEN